MSLSTKMVLFLYKDFFGGNLLASNLKKYYIECVDIKISLPVLLTRYKLNNRSKNT